MDTLAVRHFLKEKLCHKLHLVDIMSFFVLAPFDIVIIEIDADKAVETDLFGVTLNLVKKVTIIVMKTIRQVSYRMNLIFILAFWMQCY